MKTILTLFFLMASLNVSAGDIYVSANGSDKAAGTKTAPLKTLQRALRMAREWRRTQDARIAGGVNIRLVSGADFILDEPLYIRPEDSGTPESKTVITSAGNDKAVIAGGAEKDYAPILGKDWGKTMEPLIAFDKENETVTISAQSIKNLGIKSIADAPRLMMVIHQRWAIGILRVKDFRIDGDKAVVTFRNPESRWEFAHPWPQPVFDGDRGVSTFCFVNAMPKNDNVLNRLITIEGNEAESVHDIIFDNVVFRRAAWERPYRYGHVTLQGGFPIIDAYKLTENEGLPWAEGLENQAWIARPEAAVSITWAERVDFSSCEFAHLASTALDYTIGCRDIAVRDNRFFDIGGTAIMAGSFAEGPTEVHRPYGMTIAGRTLTSDRLMTERILIKGNVITDATNQDWGAVGIGCGFVRDVTIDGNEVSDVNYSGISIGWGWTPDDTGMRNNRIINNKVSGYARQLYDAGGLYTMSNQPNSFIEGNVVSAPVEAPYATNFRAFPIYFDACTDGYTVRNNTLQTSKLLKEKYGYNNPGPAMQIEK